MCIFLGKKYIQHFPYQSYDILKLKILYLNQSQISITKNALLWKIETKKKKTKKLFKV